MEIQITQCPPGYAMGIYPSKCHIPKHSQSFFHTDDDLDELYQLAKAKLAMCFTVLGNKTDDYERKSWYNWLWTKDFELWCASAKRDPEKVKKRALEVYETGFSVRAASGQGKRYEERKRYRIKAQRKNG